jgi:hypothetical protein
MTDYSHDDVIARLKPWAKTVLIAISSTWFVSITFPTFTVMRESIASGITPIERTLERMERKQDDQMRLILELYKTRNHKF